MRFALRVLGASHFRPSGFLLLHTSHSAYFFWGRDVRNPTIRSQAIVALLVSIPVLVLEVWFFKHLKL